MQANYKAPLLIYIIGVLSVWVGVKLLPNYIIRNNTSSEPTGLYFVKTPVDIEVGKRYTIKIPVLELSKKLGLEPNVKTFLKTVVAKAGDVIQVTNDGVLVNGKLLPNSKGVQSVRGIELHPLPIGYKHRLKQNEYFMLGQTARSFDSRYFGVIKRKDILKEAFWFAL
jgi:conjugative transfer signal peptidase TraF